MGKVRPSYIKTIAKELVKRYGNTLTKDFQKNKKIVEELVNCPSKRIRNKIAGYVTRLMVHQRDEE